MLPYGVSWSVTIILYLITRIVHTYKSVYINTTGKVSEEEPLGTVSTKTTSFRNLKKKKKVDGWDW